MEVLCQLRARFDPARAQNVGGRIRTPRGFKSCGRGEFWVCRVSGIPRGHLERATVPEMVEIHFEESLTSSDESSFSSVRSRPSQPPLDASNSSLRFTPPTSNLGQVLSRDSCVPPSRAMPDDLRAGICSVRYSHILEIPQFPLPPNLPDRVPSKSGCCMRSSQGDAKISVNLGPEAVASRGRSAAHGYVNLQGRVPHGPQPMPHQDFRLRPPPLLRPVRPRRVGRGRN